MKKSFFLPLLLSASLHAGLDFEVGPSYRVDWQKNTSDIINTAISIPYGDYEQFKHVTIWEVVGRAETDHCTPVYIGAEGHYGWVGSGNGNTVGTYLLTGVENYFETHRTELGGYSYDIDLFAGYRLYFSNRKLAFIPCGGYEHHEKHFRQIHGDFSLNSFFDIATQTDNYIYKDHLRGPFAGLEGEWILNSAFSVYASFHWNWFRYTALSHVSYTIPAAGLVGLENFDYKSSKKGWVNGPSAMFAINYNMNETFFLSLRATYYYTSLSSGMSHNTLYTETFSTGGVLTTTDIITAELKTRTNQWSSASGQLFLGWHF